MKVDITFNYTTSYTPIINVTIVNMQDRAGVTKAIRVLQTMRSMVEICNPPKKEAKK